MEVRRKTLIRLSKKYNNLAVKMVLEVFTPEKVWSPEQGWPVSAHIQLALTVDEML